MKFGVPMFPGFSTGRKIRLAYEGWLWFFAGMIHPNAIVAPGARVGANASVGAFAIVEDGVEVGENCRIAAMAVVKRGVVLAPDVWVDHHAVIGGLPQDLGFDESVESGVFVGRGTRIRESVTVHRATKPAHSTRIGEGCYLMAGSHVAHDCVVGSRVILANAATLGGHVHVGDAAFISGGVMVHQFVRIGEGVMCSGNGRFGMDVPPFVNALERNLVAGLNLVGLRRRGFSREVIANLKECYLAVYGDGAGGNLVAAAAAALEAGLAREPQARAFLEFFKADTLRQYVRPA